MEPVIESAEASNMLEKRIQAKCYLESKSYDTSSPTVAMRNANILRSHESGDAAIILKMWETVSNKYFSSVISMMDHFHPLQNSHLSR